MNETRASRGLHLPAASMPLAHDVAGKSVSSALLGSITEDTILLC